MGLIEGISVGKSVGDIVGNKLGLFEGILVGNLVGYELGIFVGDIVGILVGICVGDWVGDDVKQCLPILNELGLLYNSTVNLYTSPIINPSLTLVKYILSSFIIILDALLIKCVIVIDLTINVLLLWSNIINSAPING